MHVCVYVCATGCGSGLLGSSMLLAAESQKLYEIACIRGRGRRRRRSGSTHSDILNLSIVIPCRKERRALAAAKNQCLLYTPSRCWITHNFLELHTNPKAIC